MKYIASCSFGKDSLATILLAYEHKEPLDEIVYSEVMFDIKNNISGENPEHRDFIYNVAKPKLEAMGYKVNILRSEIDFMFDFHRVITKGKHEGMIRAFPIGWKCCINRDCKLPPIHKFYKQFNEPIIQYVGIAIDEPKRLARIRNTNKVSLLEKYGYTEEMAKQLCEKYGLLSPIYKTTKRNGCWFCPNQRKEELKHLYKNNNDLFMKLVELQKTPNKASEKWNRTQTITEVYEEIKNKVELEENQLTIFDFIEEEK